jgi:vesicle-associated membrane protein 7
MQLLFASISRGTNILVKFATAIGNFKEVAETILDSETLENHQITYSHKNFFINIICHNKIIYLCITDKVK